MIQSLGEFSSARVRAVFTGRSGGVSLPPFSSLNLGHHVADNLQAVQQNRQLVARHLPSAPVWLNQVHGFEVFEADRAATQALLSASPVAATADASLTQASNQVLAVLTADCLPIVLATENGSTVAAVHAGWRGLLGKAVNHQMQGVLEATVAAMRQRAPGSPIEARLGPAIGPQQFEVGPEVYAAFVELEPQMAQGFKSRATAAVPSQKYLADLYWLAQARLNQLGVQVLDGPRWCTYIDETQFFSYRREPKTGRQATLIWLANA